MKRILAYRFSALGDVAMIVPVLREFLEQNQNVEVVFVSRQRFKPLFAHINRLHFKGVDLERYHGILGLLRLGHQLLKEFKPNYICDFHDVLRSEILDLYFKTHGFKVAKIDKGKKEKRLLTDVHHLEKHQLKLTVERYADILRKSEFSLKLSHQLRVQTTDKEGIGFAPFAKHKGKILPLDKSFQAAKDLAKTEKIFFFGGGAEEVELLSRWEKEIPNSISLAGRYTLEEQLKKIAGLKLMISMDSANMHLASLAGTRVVSIWGATHPYAGFLGYGQRYEDCVQINDLTCRPCSVYGNKPCFRGDYACLNEITVSQILKKVKAALKNPTLGSAEY